MHFIWRIIIKLALNAVALYLAASFLPGFHIANNPRAFWSAAVTLALLNFLVRPILKFISFPLIILTFGLFNIIINIVILYFAERLTPSISIADGTTLIIASLIIGIFNAFV